MAQISSLRSQSAEASRKNFETLQDALYRRVKQDWDANINAKEALVKQAEALVEQDNSDGIANGAKTLQAQWREIGTTPRGADQKLLAQVPEPPATPYSLV